MKIRQGFVSNSSSSSFIVAFPHSPSTTKELKEMMFPRGETELATEYSGTYSVDTAVGRVLEDVRKLSEERGALCYKYNFGALVDEFLSGHTELDEDYDYNSQPQNKFEHRVFEKWKEATCKYPSLREYHSQIRHKFRDRYEDEDHEKRWERAMEYLKSRKAEFDDKSIFVFSYSDNDGEGWLEHGDIFRNLPHVRISHH